MKKSIIFFFALLLSFSVNAQIQWQKCLGGTNDDYPYSIILTYDSGFVVAGESNSNDGNVTGNHGSYDYCIVKLDANGNVQWQKSLGGSSYEVGYCIIQTYDSGYAVSGYTYSNDGDVTGNHGFYDYWVVKLNATGTIEWQKSLGGTNDDRANSIIQTFDSGYIVAGFSNSNDGDVIGNHGDYDYWVVKLNSSGSIQWQKSLGGTDDDEASSIIQISDSGYVVAGYTFSNDSDVMFNHGGFDCWIVKLDTLGTIQWQQSLGGTGSDGAYSIAETFDSGFIVGGISNSNDSNVTGNHGLRDYWVVKLNAFGNLDWQKCFGGTGYDKANSIIQTSDSGYIVVGSSKSNDGDVTGNHGNEDYWVVKTDASGTIQWQQSLGGTDGEFAFSVIQTYDNDYLVAGSAHSNNGDVIGNHGNDDFWLVKLGVATGIENNFTSNALHAHPNPSTDIFSISANTEFDNAQLNIFNAMGCNVYSERLSGETKVIDAENFSTGIYYVQIIKGEKMWAEKIIKQ
ncbi:MAG: T9SS type A sorting domain-containing protein [Bacteroidia bacterium]